MSAGVGVSLPPSDLDSAVSGSPRAAGKGRGVGRARAGALLWLFTLCFVPIWFGTTFIVYFYPASIVGIFVLFFATPGLPRRFGAADLVAFFFFLSCLAPVALGGATKTTIFVALSQWLVAFLVGRLLPIKVGLPWLYKCIAWFFTIVAVLAIVEFMLSWNPFVLIKWPNQLYANWSVIQLRGGVARAEGAFGHSIALGVSLALAVPMVLASGLRTSTRIVMTALILGGTVVTFSRVGMVCAVLAVVFSVLFLPDTFTVRVRITMLLVIGGVAAALAPLVSDVFTKAGSEATNSAAYRGNLLSLIPHWSVLGFSPIAYRSPSGDLFFGGYQSIDSQIILTGLTYGWMAVIFGCLLLIGGSVWMVMRRAGAPTIAVVAAIPALATVAFITQYGMVFWFVAGLAAFSLADPGRPGSSEESPPAGPAHRSTVPAGAASGGPPAAAKPHPETLDLVASVPAGRGAGRGRWAPGPRQVHVQRARRTSDRAPVAARPAGRTGAPHLRRSITTTTREISQSKPIQPVRHNARGPRHP